jgi:hypothetical protein
MHELRIDIRDKVPELEVRLEMRAQDMGLDMVRLSPEEMESYYDHECNSRCYAVLLACDGLREWLYDEAGNQLLAYESELLTWLQVDDHEDQDRTYRDIDLAVEDFPTEDDWHRKQAELALKRAVKADESRQWSRTTLDSMIRDALAKDREYTLSLILGILAEVKDPIES